jgi:hypothetical protein
VSVSVPSQATVAGGDWNAGDIGDIEQNATDLLAGQTIRI